MFINPKNPDLKQLGKVESLEAGELGQVTHERHTPNTLRFEISYFSSLLAMFLLRLAPNSDDTAATMVRILSIVVAAIASLNVIYSGWIVRELPYRILFRSKIIYDGSGAVILSFWYMLLLGLFIFICWPS